jgi:hypothetical protein
MTSLSTFIRVEAWSSLLGIALTVAYQILTGRINLRGLTNDKSKGVISTARVQLLLLTCGFAMYYFLQVIHDPSAFPSLPREAVFLMGGSNVLYLVAKTKRANVF